MSFNNNDNFNKGLGEVGKMFTQFGNNIKRAFNDSPIIPNRRVASSDDVLGLDAEAFREATIEGNDGGELATYVNEKLVYEAGVDYESRPMLVFSACRLLNPEVVDYDRLLNLIVFRLDDFVENDYTVVLLAASVKYKPSIKWLYTAYRRLGRKYKKNLKNLYIVHPSPWVRVIMTAMNAVLSPKFAKKVKWLDTLSELAAAVPIDQINIPPEVYQFNATKEREIKVPQHPGPSASRFFGVPLEALMGANGELGLPAPVADALDYLYTHALEVQDLFRRSPSSATLHKVRSQYETEGHVSVTYAVWGEHVAAAILKTWCRELPQPVIPSHYYELIRLMPDPEKQAAQAAEYARDVVLPALADPPCVSLLLAALFGLLRAIADHSAANNMTSSRLAAAWAPNFVRSSQPDVDISMCSVTRFSGNSRAHAAAGDGDDDDGDDDDVLDLEEDDSARPNVVTLAKLMIDQYQVIFKPTLEAAEAQAKERAVAPPKPPRSVALGSVPLSSAQTPAPPKPPRRAPAAASAPENKGGASSPAPKSDGVELASDEDIAALAEELGRTDVRAEGSGSRKPQVASPVSAGEIAKRLRQEQEEAEGRGAVDEEGDDSEIVIGDYV